MSVSEHSGLAGLADKTAKNATTGGGNEEVNEVMKVSGFVIVVARIFGVRK